MASDLTFTGERFLPGCTGEIAYEHWHRYAFARRFAIGKRVLDVACGEGYGTALLGAVAAEAVGVDIDRETVAHAKARYGAGERTRFIEGSCAELPLPDASFDIVVSFETIEHLDAADQPRMLAEFARVLTPTGVLVMSSPNKRLYSDERDYVNEFHRHELYRDQLAELLAPLLPAQRWYHQRLACWSGIWAEGAGAEAEAWIGDGDRVAPYTAPEGMYFVVVAAREAAALPAVGPRVSLFTDAADSELKRAEANSREVLRLDTLLKDRDAALARQTGHLQHLEALVAERERIVVERDRQLAEINAARETHLAQARAQLSERAATIGRHEARIAKLEVEEARLNAALEAQERIIAYRQSLRWWLQLPWLRARRLLDRMR